MKHPLLGALVITILGVPVMAQTPAASSKPAAAKSNAPSNYTPPRTPDGQPSLEGFWNSATYTPFERPANLKDKQYFTPEEAAAFEKTRQQAFESQAPDDIHYDNAIWQSEKTGRGLQSLRTSLVIDPPDGHVPPQTEEAVKRNAAIQAARRTMGGPYDKVQNRPLAERCIVWPHEGPPMQPVGYFSNLQFVQGPGYVVVIQEMIHNARVIPLDNRPHPGPGIQQYYGHSTGHWDGDTLVVETTNFTDKTAFRGSSSSLKVTERIRRTGPETITYQATMEDPHTWAVPWTIEYLMTKTDDPIFEYACHEGNYGMRNIMSAVRKQEAEEATRGGSK
jgi:hypothetical protein